MVRIHHDLIVAYFVTTRETGPFGVSPTTCIPSVTTISSGKSVRETGREDRFRIELSIGFTGSTTMARLKPCSAPSSACFQAQG